MKHKQLVPYFFSNKLVRSFGIYTIAKVINSSIPFLLLPIMTAYLTPADYGVISMITTVATFVMPFVSLRVEDAILRRFYYENEKIDVYIGNCLFIVSVGFFVVSLLTLAFSRYLTSITQIPIIALCVIPFYCVLTFFKNVVLYYWQVNQKPIKYGLYSIIATLVEIGVAIILIVFLNYNWIGRAISIIVSALLCAIYAFVFFDRHKLITCKFDKERLLHAMKYGVGLVPAGIGSSIMILANRFFITNMVSIDETGLYGVANSFASIMAFITISFNNAFVPWFFEKLKSGEEENKRKIVKLTYLYMIGLFVVGVCFMLALSFIIPFFVSDNFLDSIKYVPFLILGFIFQGCYFMVTNYIMYVEKTYITAFIIISCGGISIGLNYLFILLFGAVGASMAFAFTFFLFFILTWGISSKLYKMPWLLTH